MTKTQRTAEQKFDDAMESARSTSEAAMLAIMDAASCADQAVTDGQIDDGDAWYVFAVGVAANDARSAHLFG